MGLLNLPLVALEHLLSPRLLTLKDLWIGFATSIAYLSFYLAVLDPNGIHLYIILSPRTKWSPVVGGTILGGYTALWRFWSYAAHEALNIIQTPLTDMNSI